MVKSLIELGQLAEEEGIAFHVENNTAFDKVFVEPEELIDVVEEVRGQDVEIYFNFDIGHWFTRADQGKEISMPPEEVMNKIPGEMVKELARRLMEINPKLLDSFEGEVIDPYKTTLR
ncbi:hypothetical protein AKJ48_02670, partial [candidate division MSBL1 archaeon SCGC-AAA261O19]